MLGWVCEWLGGHGKRLEIKNKSALTSAETGPEELTEDLRKPEIFL
jgi:hypothetical protein